MIRRLAAAGFGALALVALVAAPAGAHAQLLGTDPTASEVLDAGPDSVTLRYSEPVEVSLGSVRLYDGSGERLELGAPEHPGGDRAQVGLDVPDLDGGSYVVTWRVISGDSHPVQGAFTFQVGPDATANIESLAEELLAAEGGDPVVGATYGVARFSVFASIAVLLGGVAFAALLAPTARRRRVARAVVWSAWGVCLGATAAAIGLQGAYATGVGLVDAARPSLVREVLDTQFGQVSALRLLLLLALIPFLRMLFARGAPDLARWWWAGAAVLAAAVAATPGFAGHASSGDHVALALVSDTLHVLAMSLWIGGLVLLVAVFLPGRDADAAEATVTRFSRLALACVGTLVVTGAFQSWRQVGSLDGLRDTEYGRLLVIKVVLFGLLIVTAAVSREVVYRLYHRDDDLEEEEALAVAPSGGAVDVGDAEPEARSPDRSRDLRRLRWSIWVEVGFAVAVLAVTAMLVNAPPARSEVVGVFATSVETEEQRIDVWVDPGDAGPNDVHVDVRTLGGGATDPLDISVSIEYPGEEIAAIDVPMQRLGPGHYYGPGSNIPLAGEWVLEVQVLVSDVEEVRAEVPITIR